MMKSSVLTSHAIINTHNITLEIHRVHRGLISQLVMIPFFHTIDLHMTDRANSFIWLCLTTATHTHSHSTHTNDTHSLRTRWEEELVIMSWLCRLDESTGIDICNCLSCKLAVRIESLYCVEIKTKDQSAWSRVSRYRLLTGMASFHDHSDFKLHTSPLLTDLPQSSSCFCILSMWCCLV